MTAALLDIRFIVYNVTEDKALYEAEKLCQAIEVVYSIERRSYV